MYKIVASEATFFPMKPNDKGLIGISSVVLNDSISLNCISVYLRPNGNLRLVFPIKILPNTKEINVFYPINSDAYGVIQEAISKKYIELTKNVVGM